MLRPATHGILVNGLISQNGLEGSDELINSYKSLLIDLVSTHTKYANVVINKLMTHWIPTGNLIFVGIQPKLTICKKKLCL